MPSGMNEEDALRYVLNKSYADESNDLDDDDQISKIGMEVMKMIRLVVMKIIIVIRVIVEVHSHHRDLIVIEMMRIQKTNQKTLHRIRPSSTWLPCKVSQTSPITEFTTIELYNIVSSDVVPQCPFVEAWKRLV